VVRTSLREHVRHDGTPVASGSTTLTIPLGTGQLPHRQSQQRQAARRDRQLHRGWCRCRPADRSRSLDGCHTTANGGAKQLWYLRPTGDGYFTIVSYGSGLVADVYGQATNDAATVAQWPVNDGANQQWQFIPS
jgi:hypothetical protein